MNKEQAAKEYCANNCNTLTLYIGNDAFIAGATWQEQHTHPHSDYMEFAEWVRKEYYGMLITEPTPTPDLFQYWIDNVKNKG